MTSSEGNTQTKILDLAENLLKTVGFNAFSYQHIAKPLGVKNAAVHYYYPTKSILAENVLTRARERAFQWMMEADNLYEPKERLSLFIEETYTRSLNNDNRICLIGSLSTDFFTISAEIQEGLKAMVDDIWQWLAALLEEGREKGVFAFKGNATNKAKIITTSLAGALQIARVAGNESYHQIVQQLMLDLEP